MNSKARSKREAGATHKPTNPKGHPVLGGNMGLVRIVTKDAQEHDDIVKYLSAQQRGEILARAARIVREATAKIDPQARGAFESAAAAARLAREES